MKLTPVFSLDNHIVLSAKQSQRHIRNVYYLRLHIITLKILGVSPLAGKVKLSRVYGSCLLGVLILCGLICGAQTFLVNHPRTVFMKCLLAMAMIALCSFFASILCSNWRNKRSWKRILELSITIDKSARWLLEEKVSLTTFLRFTLLHLAPLFYSILDGYLWFRAEARLFILDLPLFMTQHTGLFYEFQIATFLWEIAHIMEFRYTHVEENLKSVLSHKIITDKTLQPPLKYNIRKLKYRYKLLYNIIQELNIIFGWTLMTYIFHLLLICILDFYLILNAEVLKIELICEGFMFAVIIWVS